MRILDKPFSPFTDLLYISLWSMWRTGKDFAVFCDTHSIERQRGIYAAPVERGKGVMCYKTHYFVFFTFPGFKAAKYRPGITGAFGNFNISKPPHLALFKTIPAGYIRQLLMSVFRPQKQALATHDYLLGHLWVTNTESRPDFLNIGITKWR